MKTAQMPDCSVIVHKIKTTAAKAKTWRTPGLWVSCDDFVGTKPMVVIFYVFGCGTVKMFVGKRWVRGAMPPKFPGQVFTQPGKGMGIAIHQSAWKTLPFKV